MSLPPVAEPFLMVMSIALTKPSFQRSLVLTVGAILIRGPRTVLRVLSTLGPLAPGHHTDYHRLFSRAPWSTWKLGKPVARLIIDLVPPGELVVVPMDDTVLERKGKKVYGKGRHRDAKRSSQSYVAHVHGIKVVVLAVAVKLPFCRRPWALPVPEALYRPEELNRAEGRRHKTPAQLAKGLMAQLMHWFPERKFVFCGRRRLRLARTGGLRSPPSTPLCVGGAVPWRCRPLRTTAGLPGQEAAAVKEAKRPSPAFQQPPFRRV